MGEGLRVYIYSIVTQKQSNDRGKWSDKNNFTSPRLVKLRVELTANTPLFHWREFPKSP